VQEGLKSATQRDARAIAILNENGCNARLSDAAAAFKEAIGALDQVETVAVEALNRFNRSGRNRSLPPGNWHSWCRLMGHCGKRGGQWHFFDCQAGKKRPIHPLSCTGTNAADNKAGFTTATDRSRANTN